MVYHALDSPEDDYHALFVLCLLYAMSHNKGKHVRSPFVLLVALLLAWVLLSAARGPEECFLPRLSSMVPTDSSETAL